jgi:hypothetical protein
MVDETRIDELYALPPGEFTAARTSLVKETKASGDREGAAQVQALRKPTVAAWAVNQLARQRAAEVDELLAVGTELREGQKKALSGGGARALQEASARRRQLVDRLVQSGGEILENAGSAPTRAHLDEIANTLLAATVDERAAEAVRQGRLDKELPAPAGFGDVGELADVIQMPTRPKPEHAPIRATPAKVQPAAEARARKRWEELARHAEASRAEAERLSGLADQAESDAIRMREDADRAERAAARARREADRAVKRADATQERAERARERINE